MGYEKTWTFRNMCCVIIYFWYHYRGKNVNMTNNFVIEIITNDQAEGSSYYINIMIFMVSPVEKRHWKNLRSSRNLLIYLINSMHYVSCLSCKVIIQYFIVIIQYFINIMIPHDTLFQWKKMPINISFFHHRFNRNHATDREIFSKPY